MESFIVRLVLVCILARNVLSSDPMENENLFEGDIELDVGQYIDLMQGNTNPKIPLAATRTNHWPRRIPYYVSSTLRNEARFNKNLKAAIAEYEKYTCLRFHRRTNEAGYMYFYKGSGCSARVGYQKKACKINLGTRCWSKGTIMHEIAHSLGFYHEQSRPDRDYYVTINYQNIENDHKHNFKVYGYNKLNSMGSPYDFDSLMHYRSTSFSKNGKNTIDTKNPANAYRIRDKKNGLSRLDLQQLNQLYGCGTVKPLPTKPTTNSSRRRRRRRRSN